MSEQLYNFLIACYSSLGWNAAALDACLDGIFAAIKQMDETH